MARRLGLMVAVLALLAAPTGSVSHASAPDTVRHDHAASHDGPSALPCDPAHHHDAGNHDGARGADCCLAFCYVVSGPLAGPVGEALALRSPRTERLVPVDGRLPSGLAIKPALGPPRSDS